MSNTKTPETDVELIDDSPQVITADLRKFNRTKALVDRAISSLLAYSKIETPEDLALIMKDLQEASVVGKKIEEKRKSLKAPFLEGCERIDTHAKEITKGLPSAIESAKKLVLSYNTEQERIKLELQSADRRRQLVSIGMEPDPELTNRFTYETLTVDPLQVTGLTPEAWSTLVGDLVVKIQAMKAKIVEDLKQIRDSGDFFGDTDPDIEEKIQAAQAPIVPQVAGVVRSFGPSKSVKGVTKTWTFEITDASLIPRGYMVPDEVKIRQAIKDGTRIMPGLRIFQKENLTIR